MIWDAFIYSGEREILDIRLNELKGLNMYHVIVQATKTFTYNDRSVDIVEGGNIINIVVEDLPEDLDTWGRETFQRNAIMRGLASAKNFDIVMISDVDEIPRKSAVEYYTHSMGLSSLRMDVFWYKLNCLAESQTWIATKILPYWALLLSTPDKVRASGYPTVIPDSGWHFSYAGDENFIINKLESYSHIEKNIAKFKDKNKLKNKIEIGESLWDENKFQFIRIDETFPKYVQENQFTKLQHLIHNI